jgi:hypothetical protein
MSAEFRGNCRPRNWFNNTRRRAMPLQLESGRIVEADCQDAMFLPKVSYALDHITSDQTQRTPLEEKSYHQVKDIIHAIAYDIVKSQII